MNAWIPIGAVAGLIGTLLISWRQAVKIVLVLVVLEGAVRKWFLPGAADFVYFAKDAVLLMAYVKYFISPEHGIRMAGRSTLVRFFILLSGIVVLLEAINPNLGSPLVGLLGARNYLLYIPLMFLVQHLFKSQEELDRFLRRYLTLSLPVFVLSLFQYWAPPDSPLNIYVQTEAYVGFGTVGENVRVTGTFSYIAGYAAYLQVITAMAIPLLVIRHSPLWQIMFRVIFGCAVAGILLSGSRGPLIALGIFLLGYFTLNRTLRELGLYQRILVPILLCGLAITLWLGTAFDNYLGRFKANSDITDRVISCFVAPLLYIDSAGIFGFGTGATYQAADRMRSIFKLPPATPIPVYYESEPERVMLELGPLGFFLWYAFRLTLIIQLWLTFQRLRLPLLRELALTAFLVHVLILPGQMVYQITALVFYWFLAGFIFLLPELESRVASDELGARDNSQYKPGGQ